MDSIRVFVPILPDHFTAFVGRGGGEGWGSGGGGGSIRNSLPFCPSGPTATFLVLSARSSLHDVC